MARGRKRIWLGGATLFAGLLAAAATVVSMSRRLEVSYGSPSPIGDQHDYRLFLSGGRLWYFAGGGAGNGSRIVTVNARSEGINRSFSELFAQDPRWQSASQFIVGSGGSVGGIGWVLQWARFPGGRIVQGVAWPLAPLGIVVGAWMVRRGLRARRTASRQGRACCLHCGYDASGLSEAMRCPECGERRNVDGPPARTMNG